MMNAVKSCRFWLIGAILAAGIFARAADLGTHFTHVDDVGIARNILFAKEERPLSRDTIVREFLRGTDRLPQNRRFAGGNPDGFTAFLNGLYRITRIPRNWTYAPLQFLATHFLVRPDLSYREILFRGRLPSFVFGVLGLAALLFFYRLLDRWRTPAVIAALALTALSWENIIYAKQMQSYAIGVFAFILMMTLLVANLKSSRFCPKRLLLTAAGLALLSWSQYQILFCVPAFYGTLFLYARHRRRQDTGSKLFAAFGASLLFYGLLIFPVYFFFLRHHTGGGIAWNAGPENEFLFSWQPEAPLIANLLNTGRFFIENLYWVFVSNTAFIPEESYLFLPSVSILFLFFLYGIGRLAKNPRPVKKMTGCFFLLTGLTWIALVILGKLALSPTRHSLMLLPLMAVTTAEGLSGPFFRRHRKPGSGLPVITAAAVLVLFLCYLPGVMKTRQDPFNDAFIGRILKQYGVDTVLTAEWTWNTGLLKGMRTDYNVFEEGMPPHFIEAGRPSYRTLALISHREKLSPASFERLKNRMNPYHVIMQQPQRILAARLQDYALIWRMETDSDVEVDFLKHTRNGTNGFYFYILKRLPDA